MMIASTCFYSCSYIEEMIIGTSITEAKESCRKQFRDQSFQKSCLKGVEFLQSKARKYGANNTDQAIESAKGACNTEYSEYSQENDLGMTYEDACLEGIQYLKEIGEGHAALFKSSTEDLDRNSSPQRKESDSDLNNESITVIEV